MSTILPTNTHLCVGGPNAGLRVSMPEHIRRFRIAQKPAARRIRMPRGPDSMIQLKVIEYVEQEIAGLVVWAPRGQDVAQTMLLLLDAYESKASRQTETQKGD
jgi:hypothetical protein